jgi:ubiquinone/menaquinone biosynthesis C-methylase UbiE
VDDRRSRVFDDVAFPEAYDRDLVPALFDPWAQQVLARTPLTPGTTLLDVACGPGPVARQAARALGPTGRVIASDVSAPMLAVLAAKPAGSDAAPITCVECSAMALEVASDSVDVVVCQQGLQFFPDRDAAVREMARVLRHDGTAVVATWAAEVPLGLFGPMTETMAGTGLAEPFPRAFDPTSFQLTAQEMSGLLERGGFGDVTLETVTVDATWPNADAATTTLLGTPYAPLIRSLPADGQVAARAELARRLDAPVDGPVTVRTVSHIARGRRR